MKKNIIKVTAFEPRTCNNTIIPTGFTLVEDLTYRQCKHIANNILGGNFTTEDAGDAEEIIDLKEGFVDDMNDFIRGEISITELDDNNFSGELMEEFNFITLFKMCEYLQKHGLIL